MGLGQKLSVNIAPLLLRTGLAATFIWIGTPMLRTMDLTAQQTAILANADIRQPDAARPPATTPSPEITPESQEPNTPEAPDEAADPVTPPPLSGVSLTRRAGTPPESDKRADAVIGTPAYTAAQFEGTDQTARRWVLVALTALEAAEPVDDGDDATSNRTVLPPAVGNGGIWVKIGSIAFALIVAFGGYAVILGFFTRVWALGLAICTGLSMWVLEIGPTWAMRDGILGFLPDPQISNPDVSAQIWMPLMLHFVVLMTALALLIVGPGKLSLDHLMFGRGEKAHRRDGFADDGD
ncbi:MAG: hypothetical protein ABL309_07290 [Phycisphaerales bacterium]